MTNDMNSESVPGTRSLSDLSLIEFMTVEPTDDAHVFVGRTEPYGKVGIYGGHYLGQALSAAFQTVPEPMLAQSFHGYFLAAAEPGRDLEYRVTSLRDARRGATRTVAAFQGDKQVFFMMAAFKEPEVGEQHQKQAPEMGLPGTPEHESAASPLPFTFPMAMHDRVEMIWASKTFFEGTPGEPHPLRIWMRVPGGEKLNERDRQIAMAFLSDGPLMFNAIVHHGLPMETHWSTSIDQASWFHRPANPGEWMLFDQRSTNAADGRGMNEGEIYSADGQMLMTCSQESVLRRIPSDKPAH